MARSKSTKGKNNNSANKGNSSNGRGTATVAATMDPGVADAIGKAVATIEVGNREEAHEIFRQTVEHYPKAPEAWIWLGGTSPSLDDAQAAFELAQELDPNNEQAQLGLRWVRLRREGWTAPAVQAMEIV